MPAGSIRVGRDSDLPALTDIYNYYVVHSHVTFDLEPFTVEHRRSSWWSHYAPTGPYRVLVGLDGDRPIGYATSSPFRPKPGYRTSVETSVYLHPDHVGRGHGVRLYLALIDHLETQDVHRAYAGVALPNVASDALHRRLGFEALGTFGEVGFKGRFIDVTWYERAIGGSGSARSPRVSS